MPVQDPGRAKNFGVSKVFGPPPLTPPSQRGERNGRRGRDGANESGSGAATETFHHASLVSLNHAMPFTVTRSTPDPR